VTTTHDLPTGSRTPGETDSRCRADRARQVADALRFQILHGELRDGPFPTEAEIVADFAVSRNTVREALALLNADGLLRRVPGVGTTPVEAKLPHSIDHLQGLAETLVGHGAVVNEVRVAQVVPAPEAIAARLRIAAGDPVLYLERRRLVDGVPLSLDLTYVVADLGAHLLDADLTGNDVFALIESFAGQRLEKADLVMEAVAADRHSAATLGVAPGSPLLMLERLSHLGGRPVDLEYIRFRGDRVAMRGSVHRPTEEIR
jgi:GntR family transcriptional regulator